MKFTFKPGDIVRIYRWGSGDEIASIVKFDHSSRPEHQAYQVRLNNGTIKVFDQYYLRLCNSCPKYLRDNNEI